MGNTCGCVDPAEKTGEVHVEHKQNRQNLNQYRESNLGPDART